MSSWQWSICNGRSEKQQNRGKKAGDGSRTFRGDDLAQLVYTHSAPRRSAAPSENGTELAPEPRWVVFPSRDKHGSYATVAICEDSVIPCLAEQCAPDGVADPAAFDRIPAVVNAGEDGARLVEDLSGLGFPGDDAWADQPFCGGHGDGNCSAKIRDKLTIDPFGVL